LHYARAARNLSRFFRTGIKDEAAFHDWRALHCKTNGRSTDILNWIVETVSDRPDFGAVSAVGGDLQPSRRREIVSCVERRGILVFVNASA
jgi:hypothetical protein